MFGRRNVTCLLECRQYQCTSTLSNRLVPLVLELFTVCKPPCYRELLSYRHYQSSKGIQMMISGFHPYGYKACKTCMGRGVGNRGRHPRRARQTQRKSKARTQVFAQLSCSSFCSSLCEATRIWRSTTQVAGHHGVDQPFCSAIRSSLWSSLVQLWEERTERTSFIHSPRNRSNSTDKTAKFGLFYELSARRRFYASQLVMSRMAGGVDGVVVLHGNKVPSKTR